MPRNMETGRGGLSQAGGGICRRFRYLGLYGDCRNRVGGRSAPRTAWFGVAESHDHQTQGDHLLHGHGLRSENLPGAGGKPGDRPFRLLRDQCDNHDKGEPCSEDWTPVTQQPGLLPVPGVRSRSADEDHPR
ncbi:hypothetical protein SDC9_148107 [bioreactor metagenome]|uniref:Uncharacterized protein n=1 Tax=bioreactor metagenome TaxID=1076179 RepID=A0A645EID6_9ZZZZ